jgi:hypothetical protein
LVTSPSGDVSLQGYNLQITPQPGVSVEQQATQACKTHCDTKCDTRKTIVDTVGYNKRAIFDAMGWDSHKPAPYERWALVGPTIVPSGSSIAYTMLSIFFIIFAIWAFVHSIVRSQSTGSSSVMRAVNSVMRAVNAIVAAYFGPIYLAIAYIAGSSATEAVPEAVPEGVSEGVPAAAKNWYVWALGALAAVAGIVIVLLGTGVITVGKPKVFVCPPGWTRNADGTACAKPDEEKKLTP